MRTTLPLLCTLAIGVCHAHTGDLPAMGTSVNAAISTSWRDNAGVEESQRWQIPGLLMGGEALPVEKGLVLDEARLSLTHNTNTWHAQLETGTHDNADSIELEQAFAGYRFRSTGITLTLEGGQRVGVFSPYNGQHPSERLFSEATLLQDAFLGRHFADRGFHLRTQFLQSFTLGLEHWRGDSHPATEGKNGGANDIYLHWQKAFSTLDIRSGAWGMRAEADDREDTRYSGGHSHGNVTLESPAYWFDGQTDTAGIFVVFASSQFATLKPSLTLEWLQQSVDGDVRDETRLAHLDGDYNAWRIEPSITWHQHQIGLRYEQLVLENALSGNGAAPLADTTGLNNPGVDPERIALAYRYALSPAFSLRAEYTQEKTQWTGTQLDQRNRVALGIIWQDTLWKQR